MDYSYITNPVSELQTLALAYVQSRNTADLTPEQFLDAYSDALNRMWEHYNADE